MKLNFDPSKMISNLVNTDNKFDVAIRMFADNAAIDLQNDARNNAKWVDRTGAARQRLKGTAGKISTGYRLTLSHGVDYGIWLELANERKYSILDSTIRYTGGFKIMPSFEKFMDKLK